MAGVAIAINVEIDDREVVAALRRLQSAGADMEPVFRTIGERMLASTRQRFTAERDPDGRPWAPLADSTILGRMRRAVRKDKSGRRRLADKGGGTKSGAIGALAGLKILQDRGTLHDTLRYHASASGVEIGTDRIYGATHQFGRDNIPARPFLGLSESDRQDILAIVRDHLARAMAG